MEEIVLAFEGEKTGTHIRDILEGAGVANCLLCHSGAEVKRLVDVQGITMVICGCKLRDSDAESLFVDLPAGCSMLVIGKKGSLDLMGNDNIFKLPAPVAHGDLLAAVRMLLHQERRVRRSPLPERSAEEKALLEKAKTILREQYAMSENQAHRFLQKRSMDSGVKILQTAQMILDERENFGV